MHLATFFFLFTPLLARQDLQWGEKPPMDASDESNGPQRQIRSILSRSHTLVKPYQTIGGSMAMWDFTGNTMITNSQVRLTAELQSQRGAVWSSLPCSFRDWEIHINFKIHGKNEDLFGDGMAIWYTQSRMKIGAAFGNEDPFTGLGVFIDTYSNHNGPHNHLHPYVSAMVNNGSITYDHDLDGTLTQLAGCHARARGRKVDTLIAIRYAENVLTVSVDMDGKNKWEPCFQVKGVHLPVGYYFGASAATGDLADNHDIISIRVYELEILDRKEEPEAPAPAASGVPYADSAEPMRPRVDDPPPSSRWATFFRWVLYLVGAGMLTAVVVALVCLVISRRNESYNKRFY